MSKTLLELVSDSHSIIRQIIENDGQISPETEKELELIDAATAEKVDNYAFMIDYLVTEERFLREQAEPCLKNARACKRVYEKLRERMSFVIRESGKKEMLGHRIKFSLRELSPELIIDDLDMIDVKFKKEVTTTEIDEKQLMDSLLCDEKQPGAHIEKRFSLYKTTNLRSDQK